MKALTTCGFCSAELRIYPSRLRQGHNFCGKSCQDQYHRISRAIPFSRTLPPIEDAQEEWRPVEGWPYQVSNLGRVRQAETKRVRKPRLIRGYPSVFLRATPRRTKTAKVHCLVAEAFIGARPPGMQINHIDGGRIDARPENLEYVTPAENTRHAARLGRIASGDRHHFRLRPETRPAGERNGRAKLTREQAVEIRRRLFDGGEMGKDLAREFGVGTTTISRIRKGLRWQ